MDKEVEYGGLKISANFVHLTPVVVASIVNNVRAIPTHFKLTF